MYLTNESIAENSKRRERGMMTNRAAVGVFYVALLSVGLSPSGVVTAFSPVRHTNRQTASWRIQMSTQPGEPDDPSLQWDLFQKYHASGGSWKGIWTTHDYLGDVMDEIIASVDFNSSPDGTVIKQTHKIVTGATRSDCATCFDRMETRDIPVATYTADTLRQKKVRLAANALVYGPSLTRSGIMATELVQSQGNARVRVIFQHGPVWERGVEPGSCPPSGLKLVRVVVSRECCNGAPPTPEAEAVAAGGGGGATSNPIFYRAVPPFFWHKPWSGTSWTWGANTGNRGWRIEALQEGNDDWHGSAPVELWNLRLPGGIFVQAPRIITDAEVGLCRLAWLPNDDSLLRVEAGVSVLQPKFIDDATMVGFEPPSLISLRCDVLDYRLDPSVSSLPMPSIGELVETTTDYKSGVLEGQPSFVNTDRREDYEKQKDAISDASSCSPSAQVSSIKRDAASVSSKASGTGSTTNNVSAGGDDNDSMSDLQKIRDSLLL
jgi:hypothetical protein